MSVTFHISERSHMTPGGGYTTSRIEGDVMAWLRNAHGDELNIFIPSTSGIHGSYMTLDEIELLFDPEREVEARERHCVDPGEPLPIGDELTFCFIRPRLASLIYGNVRVTSKEDVEFLRQLTADSLDGMRERCDGNLPSE